MDIIWIIAGIALYWLVVTALDFLGVFEGTNLDTAGPLFLIRTYRGRKFLERLSRRRRFWRIYGNLGIAVAVTVMALVFVFLLYVGFVSVVSPPQPSSLTQPQNLVVVPGVNEFLPLSVAFEIVMGLAIGIIVHEGGHGVMCKANDIGVSSMGLVSFAVLPVGAFVEPDEDEVEEADSGSRTRMFAAGVMNNFVITIAAFVLIALLLFSVQPIDGVGVKSVENGSLAGKADIEGGDVVKSVNGE
ncbi:MAG: site-2 protease family protein, partial [Halobacteria archaeon]|nr:site-2 protease family protein [Halobacteria archaeon]